MICERREVIAASFGRSAQAYDRHAGLQARVARRLARFLPALATPRVLEIGCGTGLLTQHLLRRYRDGTFMITDIAGEMVTVCRQRFAQACGERVRFATMDGEFPTLRDSAFDLIATSMTLQWFLDPAAGLQRLRGLLAPGGALFYATLGPDGFPEWRAALAEEGLREGTIAMPDLPGVMHEERPMIDYGCGLDFLKRLRGIGADTPRADYRSLSPGTLRRVLRRLDEAYGACVTWHIVYGRLSA